MVGFNSLHNICNSPVDLIRTKISIKTFYTFLSFFLDTEDCNESQNEEVSIDKYKKRQKPNRFGRNILSSFFTIFLSVIILTLTTLTYLQLFIILRNLTMTAQTMNVSSEGPISTTYPESMGQYKILKDVYRNGHSVYQHMDREDRFIIYSGSNKSVCKNCLFELSGEFWFFTNDLSDEDGHIRSKEGRKLLVPEKGWLYVNQDVVCTTVR